MPTANPPLPIAEAITAYGPFSYFSTDTGTCSQSLVQYGEWAGNEISFCGLFLSPGDFVLDGGGFIGTHAVAFSRMVGPRGLVVSVEAQPDSHILLSQNTNLLGASEVQALHCALVEEAGQQISIKRLDVRKAGSLGSCQMESGEDVLVPTTSIREIVRNTGRIPSLIKLDLEGMEATVLRGASGVLASCHPTIYAETNTLEIGVQVLWMLRAAGYQTWLHLPFAYNPQNFRRNPSNIFGSAREAALVGVHGTAADLLAGGAAAENPNWGLFPVETADDLAAGLLMKPQYAFEVLETTTAARLGKAGRPWRGWSGGPR